MPSSYNSSSSGGSGRKRKGHRGDCDATIRSISSWGGIGPSHWLRNRHRLWKERCKDARRGRGSGGEIGDLDDLLSPLEIALIYGHDLQTVRSIMTSEEDEGEEGKDPFTTATRPRLIRNETIRFIVEYGCGSPGVLSYLIQKIPEDFLQANNQPAVAAKNGNRISSNNNLLLLAFGGRCLHYCFGGELDRRLNMRPTEEELKLLIRLLPTENLLEFYNWSSSSSNSNKGGGGDGGDWYYYCPLQLCLHPSSPYSDNLKEFVVNQLPNRFAIDEEYIIAAADDDESFSKPLWGPMDHLQTVLSRIKSFKSFCPKWDQNKFLRLLQLLIFPNHHQQHIITTVHLCLPHTITLPRLYNTLEELLLILDGKAVSSSIITRLSIDFSQLSSQVVAAAADGSIAYNYNWETFLSFLTILPALPCLQRLTIDVGIGFEYAVDTLCHVISKGILQQLTIYCRPVPAAQHRITTTNTITTNALQRQQHQLDHPQRLVYPPIDNNNGAETASTRTLLRLLHQLDSKPKQQQKQQHQTNSDNNQQASTSTSSSLTKLLVYGAIHRSNLPDITPVLIQVLQNNTTLKVLEFYEREDEENINYWRTNTISSSSSHSRRRRRAPQGLLGTYQPTESQDNFDWYRSSSSTLPPSSEVLGGNRLLLGRQEETQQQQQQQQQARGDSTSMIDRDNVNKIRYYLLLNRFGRAKAKDPNSTRREFVTLLTTLAEHHNQQQEEAEDDDNIPRFVPGDAPPPRRQKRSAISEAKQDAEEKFRFSYNFGSMYYELLRDGVDKWASPTSHAAHLRQQHKRSTKDDHHQPMPSNPSPFRSHNASNNNINNGNTDTIIKPTTVTLVGENNKRPVVLAADAAAGMWEEQPTGSFENTTTNKRPRQDFELPTTEENPFTTSPTKPIAGVIAQKQQQEEEETAQGQQGLPIVQNPQPHERQQQQLMMQQAQDRLQQVRNQFLEQQQQQQGMQQAIDRRRQRQQQEIDLLREVDYHFLQSRQRRRRQRQQQQTTHLHHNIPQVQNQEQQPQLQPQLDKATAQQALVHKPHLQQVHQQSLQMPPQQEQLQKVEKHILQLQQQEQAQVQQLQQQSIQMGHEQEQQQSRGQKAKDQLQKVENHFLELQQQVPQIQNPEQQQQQQNHQEVITEQDVQGQSRMEEILAVRAAKRRDTKKKKKIIAMDGVRSVARPEQLEEGRGDHGLVTDQEMINTASDLFVEFDIESVGDDPILKEQPCPQVQHQEQQQVPHTESLEQKHQEQQQLKAQEALNQPVQMQPQQQQQTNQEQQLQQQVGQATTQQAQVQQLQVQESNKESLQMRAQQHSRLGENVPQDQNQELKQKQQLGQERTQQAQVPQGQDIQDQQQQQLIQQAQQSQNQLHQTKPQQESAQVVQHTNLSASMQNMTELKHRQNNLQHQLRKTQTEICQNVMQQQLCANLMENQMRQAMIRQKQRRQAQLEQQLQVVVQQQQRHAQLRQQHQKVMNQATRERQPPPTLAIIQNAQSSKPKPQPQLQRNPPPSQPPQRPPKKVIYHGPPTDDHRMKWPPGWMQKTKQRMGGSTKGTRKDNFFYSPKGYEFRSIPEVKRFLKALADCGGQDEKKAYHSM